MKEFVKDVVDLLRLAVQYPSAVRGSRLAPRFKERVMLAVTAVNQCKYCAWVHTKLALESGCGASEVRDILQLQFDGCDESELAALAFAQHHADTRGRPAVESVRSIVKEYGPRKATEIIIAISMITIGNKTGNTLDALKARLSGARVEGGSLFLELPVFLLGIVPALIL